MNETADTPNFRMSPPGMAQGVVGRWYRWTVTIRVTSTQALYAVLFAAALAITHYHGVSVGMRAAPLTELRETREALDSARLRIRALNEQVEGVSARSVLDAQARQLGPRR